MSGASIVLFVVFFLLLLTTLPISYSLGLTTFLYIYYYTFLPLEQVSDTLFNGLNSFPLMAIPFFVLAANIMTRGGISRRLTEAANAVVGGLAGGLGITAVLSCMLFAAISGSSAATVVAIGTLLIPAMIKAGYGRDFPTGLIATSGGLGILIPPSVPMIVYGVVTETSVGDLLLGGIYGGLFTPTEAAAMACFYSLIVTLFVYREMSFKQLVAVFVRSARMSAMIMFIIANAILFTFVLSLERIPSEIADLFIQADLSKWVFLFLVNILFLIVGCLMDSIGAILILAPILYPVATGLGVDPVHFGIVIVMNMEIGAVTPPLGINLFVASGISRLSALRIAKAAIPNALVLLLALFLVTYIPDISLAILGREG